MVKQRDCPVVVLEPRPRVGSEKSHARSEVRELRRAREMYEEVELGLTRLREAIEAGDLELDGVKTD